MSRRWDEDYQDDWGARAVIRVADNGRTAMIQRYVGGVSINGHPARGKWLIMVILSVLVWYSLIGAFSNDMSTGIILAKDKFIPNSPHSMGDRSELIPINQVGIIGGSSDIHNNDNSNCRTEWAEEKLVGRCFGLSIHTKYKELRSIKVVTSPDHCKKLCCQLGSRCQTWQYWNEIKRCNLGPKVKIGSEIENVGDGTANWCEAEAPVEWRGRRILNRDGPLCEWGDSLPTQCHGMGLEKRGDDGNRLARNVCERACCHIAGCTMWQQHPDRGCFIGSGENIICESYTGTFIGGRKK